MVRNSGKSRRQFESLEHRHLLAADVFISEFAATNSNGLLDVDGDTSDWVEIYNAGPDDINLQGWHLTDDDAELDKWSFPDQTLPGGSYLVVFASGKDRTDSGMELHTNFRISSGGEYLALTQDGEGDTVEVVSEFAPEFPQQLADTSYGVVQSAESTGFVQHDSVSRYLVTTTTPAAGWDGSGDFQDTDWQDGTAALGYQTSVLGFTVTDASSSGRIFNLSEAQNVLDGIRQVSQTTVVTPVIDFFDTGGTGNFANDLPFPNDGPGDDNNFAVRATGTISIPTTGRWTFGVNSDDGARLRINGNTIINDDRLHAPQDNFGSVQLEAGDHELELIYFELGGGAEVELFAAEGSFNSFNGNFRLIGDIENGGLVVTSAASGGESSFGGLVTTDVIDDMPSNATSAYLRIPFEVEQPDVLEALRLRLHYNDGFVAYLNGTEVARRNAPDDVTATSVAEAHRSVAESLAAEDFNLSPFLDQLISGQNVLAIQGLNEDVNSDNFLVAAELSQELVVTDKEQFVYFDTPTPGTVNGNSGAAEFLSNDITFSHPHGFYSEDISVAIETELADVAIRYTTDGSVPTLTNGQDYDGPVAVNSTTTLRARLFKPGALPSHTETTTYLFIDDILQQSPNGQAPEGFPTSRNINGQQLDYGMDPAIVNSARYGDMVDDALFALPSMSLVLDVDDLLDSDTGIYTNAQSHGRAWERAGSLELIYPDGTEGFQVNTGIRIRGGFSRSGNNPKHAFRLFFRGEYGDDQLEFPLFGEEGTDTFEKIDLRTAQNYSWSFQGDGRNTFLRDVFSRDVQGQMGQPYTHSEYYHLYINGQYWGIYQTQERAEANYGASYFGGDVEDYDVVKSAGSSGGYANEATDGTLEAYQRLADFFYQNGGLSDANMDDYFRAQGMNPDGTRNPDYERLLDVENLIDYMVITYYTSDADGPGSKFTRPRVNNYFGIFNRENPDGFKFFEHDSEHSLDTGNAAGANYNMVTPLTTGGSEFRYFNPHWMHERLAETNSEYQQKFADAVYRHLYNEGPFTVDAALTTLNARASEIENAIVAESARWGDAKRSSPYTLATWENAVEDVRDWIADRIPTVINQLENQGWYDDVVPPQFAVDGTPQWGGPATGTLTIAGAQEGRTVYYSLDGSDPRAIGGEVNATAIAYDAGFTLDTTTVVSARWLEDGNWSTLSQATFEIEALTGDIDGDGLVGFSDFLILSGNFGTSPANLAQGDLNGDATVNFADFLILSGNFGTSREAAPLAAAPAVAQAELHTATDLILAAEQQWEQEADLEDALVAVEAA